MIESPYDHVPLQMQLCDFEIQHSINLLTAFKSRAHISQQIIDLI